MSGPANETHPLARWLQRTADLLDRIYVRRYDPGCGRWGNASLVELDIEEAAAHVARWLVEGHMPVAVPARKETQLSGERVVGHLLLKKNGSYQGVEVVFDLNRGKFWLHFEDGDMLSIEAPRLRRIVARYDQHLAGSGLPPRTEDGHRR